jgi:hypothetical protein
VVDRHIGLLPFLPRAWIDGWMLLLSPLAFAAPPSMEALAAHGAAAVLRCDDVGAVIGKLGPLSGAPEMLARTMTGSLTMAGFGPGEPVMWLTPLDAEAAASTVDPPMRGALPAQPSPRVIPTTAVARSASFGRGCVAVTDLGALSAWSPAGLTSGAANVTGQISLYLPEGPGPLAFTFTGAPPALPSADARNLDLSLMVADAPDAVLVTDRLFRSKSADPKAERQARQLNAAFPVDGLMLGLWFDTKLPQVAGTVSLSRNIKAKALLGRLEAALRKGKVTYTRDGAVLSFTVGALLATLDTTGAEVPPALGGVALYLTTQDGRVLVSMTRDGLDALSAGGAEPFVSPEVKARLAENDLVMSVRGYPELFSATTDPAFITMRSTPEGWAGTVALPRGYVDLERLQKGMAGQGQAPTPAEPPM